MAKNQYPELKMLGVGFELAGVMGVMALIGYYVLDNNFGTYPIWTCILCFLGMIGGIYNLIKETIKANKEADEYDKKQSGE